MWKLVKLGSQNPLKKPKVSRPSADTSDMDISSIALQGLEQVSAQLDAAASNIAGAGSQNGATLDVVSLSQEVVALITLQAAFASNIDVLKTGEQTQQSILNVLA